MYKQKDMLKVFRKNIVGFTLIELLAVVIIVGLVAMLAIPMLTNIAEEQKGKVCKNYILLILAAWRIYNLTEENIYVAGIDDGFKDMDTINTDLNTEIEQNIFGEDPDPGFYMQLDETAADSDDYRLRIRTYRLTGSHQGECIACDYYYNIVNYNWDPDDDPWDTTWTLPLE